MKKIINELIIRGTIINLNISNKIASARVAVEGSTGVSNYPLVIFYDPSLLTGYNVKDRVVIKGHTQNYPIPNQLNERRTTIQTSFICDTIQHARRMLLDFFKEDDVPNIEGAAANDINTVIWAGKVKSVTTFDEKKHVSVLRVGNEKKDHRMECDFSCFERIHTYAVKLKPEDDVIIVGKISTSSKTKGKKKLYYQNVIAMDIYSPNVEERKNIIA